MFSDPEINLREFDIRTGMEIADLGAGTGFYTLPAAKMLLGTGRVFAVEVQKDLLSRLKASATEKGVGNVEVIWGNIEKLGGTRLRDRSVDRVIVSNVLFQVEDKETFVKEIARILKPEGKVLLIDWSDTSALNGPGKHLITREKALEVFGAGGFVEDKELKPGEHHYGLIFRKK